MEVVQAFPDLILAMAIGTGMPAVIAAVAITRIPFGGRVIRSVALSVRESSYVEAGRASGASAARIISLHVLPQCLAPYLVLATTHLGVAIVIEAALGFLGVGIPPVQLAWVRCSKRPSATRRRTRIETRGIACTRVRVSALHVRVDGFTRWVYRRG